MINPIVVINYNGSSNTIALIDSLTSKSEEAFDLIVVDNQSPKHDELQIISDYVQKHYCIHSEILQYTSDRTIGGCILRISNEMIVTLIQGRDNYGFAIGTNIGLRYAIATYPEEEYLTILNNDTEVTRHFLTTVIKGIEKHDLVAAMGTILYFGYEKPYIWSIGGPIDFIKGQGVHMDKDKVFNPENVKEDFVERRFISGCFTVFKRKPLIEIGLLDEDYFFAGEEYQYSFDLTKKYKIGWIPNSKIYHKSIMGIGNGSSHRITDLCWQYNSYMNKLVFINKNTCFIYRKMWHVIFRAYLLTKVKKKYLSIPEYGTHAFTLLKSNLLKNINKRSFRQSDFTLFKKNID